MIKLQPLKCSIDKTYGFFSPAVTDVLAYTKTLKLFQAALKDPEG